VRVTLPYEGNQLDWRVVVMMTMAARRKSKRRTARPLLNQEAEAALRPELPQHQSDQDTGENYGIKLLAMKGSVPVDVAL
jgi:hypothetical protein